jgi:hypothetical protein
MPSTPPPRFHVALRLTAFGARASFTLTLALVAADIASQLAAPHERPIWFGIAGGTMALCAWRMWGWILKRVGI